MTRRTIFWLLTSLVFLLCALLLLLQTSFFQNYLANFVLEKINEKTNQTAKFTNIKIKWFDFVEIKDLEVFDYKGNKMIHASLLEVDYQFGRLISDGNLLFDRVTIHDGGLDLVKYDDTLDINLVEYVHSLGSLNRKSGVSGGKSTQLNLDEIHLDNFSFSYNNHLKDSIPEGLFDYGHFKLKIPMAVIENFSVRGDTIQAGVRSLAAKDPASGLVLNELRTDFTLSNAGLRMENLYAETPHSVVRDHIDFEFSGISDLNTFVDSVYIEANLIGSKISKKDLIFFARIPIQEDFTLDVTSRVSGSVRNLRLEKMKLSMGDQTHLHGNVDFTGLPNIGETFIDAWITEGELYLPDLESFVGNATDNIAALGNIRFSGRFLGFVNDFVANAEFHSGKGDLISDLNLKFPDKWEDASYSGKLVLRNFDAGAVLKDSGSVGKINLTGTIDGKGLTQSKAKLFLNATFKESQFLGYTFDEIRVNGDLAKEFFKGSLAVNDENCVINAAGNANLGVSPEAVSIHSAIQKMNLRELGITRRQFRLATSLDAAFSGLTLDSLQGEVKMNDLGLHWDGDSVLLDSLQISSFRAGDIRSARLAVPDLKVAMEGDFMFSRLIRDVVAMAEEIKDYFTTDDSTPEKFVTEDEDFENYTIDFSINYENINRYISIFTANDLYLSDHGQVTGTYYQRKNATLRLFANVDSINYRGIGYNDNSFDVNFSKDLDSAGIIASLYLNSREQIWRHIKPTRDLELEGVWFNNKINFNLNIEQPENESSAAVNAEVKLLGDRITFSVLPSRVMALGERWFFNPFNKVHIMDGRVIVDRLELYQNEQSIHLSGDYSDSARTDLTLKLTDFDLNVLNTIVPSGLGGVLNSTINLDRKEASDPIKLVSELGVEQFRLNDFEVGNIMGSTRWNSDARGLQVDLGVVRKGINTIAVSGFYYPDKDEDQFDIKSEFHGAALALTEPFLSGLFSGVSGLADGEVTLGGTPARPVLNGNAALREGRLTFDYLGTTYDFDGDISLDNNAINFQGIRIVDREGDRASLNGKILHDGFHDFYSDLKIHAGDFTFLNTTASDNSLYYGTANASGEINITGPFEDLLIQANVTTEKGTRIYIPLSSETDVSQKDYISFVDLTDTTSQVNIEEMIRQSVSGVRLDLDVDVTPDAYVELIFNIKTGDIIRGRGNGNLNLTLDTNGEFELFGDITITEGDYNFTIPNFINKEFTIVPGSTISWYGDPYAGILNLEATYRQLASFEDFRPVSSGQEAVHPRYPILVVLKLKGEMLSPAIDFELKLDESQTSLAANQQFMLQYINNDEQELKRQVFSLLILRKFSQPQSFQVGATDVNSSVSEFLSNQFSYFISQVDENLEVDVDLTALDANAFNTFQLRFSYTFFDGRLRVTGGGAFPQRTPDDASATNFIGDWTVRYLLTSDGHLRVKAFSQAEQIAGTPQRETGVSFQYVKSFDDLRELLSRTREEAIQTSPKNMSKEREVNSAPGT